MNKQEFMVYQAVYSGALTKKASQDSAKKMADEALDKYRKNQFRKKVIDLIEDHIKLAVQLEKSKTPKNANHQGSFF